MERIPQSVAKLVVFRAFLSADGVTPATGKTIAITISKNGAAFGNPNAGATNATEISSGFYKFTLDTTDIGTVGPLAWRGAHADIYDAADIYTVCTDLADLTTLITTIDTVVDAIKAKTDNLPSDPADASVIAARFDTLDTSIDDLPTTAEVATPADIAEAVWQEPIATHSGVAGSTAEALADAAAGGGGGGTDPWLTALPGAYAAGTAGKIVGDNLNATVGSRATQTSVDAVDTVVDAILIDTGTTLDGKINTIDTVVDAIKLKTDSLAFTVAGQVDANVQAINNTALIGDGDTTPWGPA